MTKLMSPYKTRTSASKRGLVRFYDLSIYSYEKGIILRDVAGHQRLRFQD